MPNVRKSYQEGSIERVHRRDRASSGVYRWWERTPDGRRIHHSKLIGSVADLPTLADARREVESFRIGINAGAQKTTRRTVTEACEHFEANELRDPEVGRSSTTIRTYLDNFRLYIMPRWGETALEDVRSAAVEKWLRSLVWASDPDRPLSPSAKAKLRNQLSCLFSHCIRHEIYTRLNPIRTVGQGAQRWCEPDLLTIEEIWQILAGIASPAIRVMAAMAAASALRRSEIRGLKFEDLDPENCWFNLRRGVMRTEEKDENPGQPEAARDAPGSDRSAAWLAGTDTLQSELGLGVRIAVYQRRAFVLARRSPEES